ncbi:MAG TPA: hypothetical protein VHC92_08190 [Rhodanobacteraceae bacterium]|nr:hypothetical protein [Rhodanobacteraceae bacterium]
MWLTSADFDKACVTGFIAAGFLADLAAAFFFIAMDRMSPAFLYEVVDYGCFGQRRRRSLAGFREKRQQQNPFFKGFFCESIDRGAGPKVPSAPALPRLVTV